MTIDDICLVKLNDMKLFIPFLFLSLINTNAMAKEISTEIKINASKEKIWQILTDFEQYSAWNPFIKQINGNVSVNEKITVKIQPPEAKEMTFKPKVLSYKKNQEFSWKGRLLLPGIFDGEHKFQLRDNLDGTTTFIHSEVFKGILVPFLKKNLDVNTRNGFVLMNEKLKELAEKQPVVFINLALVLKKQSNELER